MSCALLLGLTLLAEPSSTAKQPSPTSLQALDRRRFMAMVSVRGGIRALHDAPGGGGSIDVGGGIRLWRGLYVEAELGEGAYAPPTHVVGRIAGGLRWELRKTRVRPSFALGFSHLHQQRWQTFTEQPGRTLIGSSDGIRHRSGIAGGLGLRIPFPSHWPDFWPHLSTLLRLDAGYHFGGHAEGETTERTEVGPPLFVTFAIGLSAVF